MIETRIFVGIAGMCLSAVLCAQIPPDEFAAARVAKWVRIGDSENGNLTMFVDTASIVITDHLGLKDTPIRKAWVKGVFASDLPHPISSKVTWSSFVVYESVYCFERDESRDYIHVYFTDKSLQDPPELIPAAFNRVVSKGDESATIAFICAWKPK